MKYIITLLSAIGILAMNVSSIMADHFVYSYCEPGLYIEIVDDTLYYDPLLSMDCQLNYNGTLDNHYEILDVGVLIQHQVLNGNVWQAGPKTHFYNYTNWDLYDRESLYYYLISGGVIIDGYNLDDYNRYRLVVTVHAATTHTPFIEGFEVRDDVYATDWLFGANSVELNPALGDPVDQFLPEARDDDEIPDFRPPPEVNPLFDDAPTDFLPETRDDDEIPDFPPSAEVNPLFDDASTDFASESNIATQDNDNDGLPNETDQCPDLYGSPHNGGCPMITINDLDPTNLEHTIQLPIDQYACTVETAFNWVFAFNIAPNDAIPSNTHPIAILNGDFDVAGNPNTWIATHLTFDNSGIEYMVNPGWASLARTGGNCGNIG